ncbi:(4Fe-4S)-binding protein [Leptospira wolffii]|uniref:(4Fe-4S)-binding protein n=1 Tax=Leptospira wolffii TaxID=409998 RepID=A0ABV5BM57_9LEPT|nr:(4Fe-4S)-binding protein [Leptospira wolffii]EPG66977.1 divergent 4Fe-4S mono-cluster [Leptospira wolffii serovar Khorat str. Khorat-H2]
MSEVVKKYTNGEITVIWKPDVCIHSAICFRGLPAVFHPKKIPWVRLGETPSERIMDQIDRCPSGALSYIKNSEIKD